MKYPIDISVFSPDRAVGMISGELEFFSLPRIGETISFGVGKSTEPRPAVRQFSWQLRVEHVIHPSDGSVTLLALEDFNAASDDEALAVMAYLEQAFDFLVHYWGHEKEPTPR